MKKKSQLWKRNTEKNTHLSLLKYVSISLTSIQIHQRSEIVTGAVEPPFIPEEKKDEEKKEEEKTEKKDEKDDGQNLCLITNHNILS